MAKSGYVYLLADTLNDGIYKIGVTTGSIDKRIKKLQTGNAGEIYICRKHKTDYPFFVEKKLHMKFAKENVLNEWFSLDDAEAMSFNDECEKIEELIREMSDNPFFRKELKM